MIDFSPLLHEIEQNSSNLDHEFRRLFHGRGGVWQELRFITIDSIDTILFVQLFFDNGKEVEAALITLLEEFMQRSRHETLIVKRRYDRPVTTEVVVGRVHDNIVAIEDGIKFKLNLLENQNIGYFGDMKEGRRFIRNIAKDKRVLNLFSYTCGFSLAAKMGGAREVVNVDMSKRVLATGMQNHHLNTIDLKGVSFLPYNILKSFPKLQKRAPFDIIIIDPPTFQKRSFAASNDYIKIIQQLESLATHNATLLASLNAPDLDENFLKELIAKHAPSFLFQKRLPNVKEYKSLDEQRSLKNLVFQREV